MLDIERERDPETLRLACRAYDKANRQLIERVQRLTIEVAELRGLDASQVTLDLPQVVVGNRPEPAAEEKISSGTPEVRPKKTPRTGHGPTEQTCLPRGEVFHRFDREPDCAACSGTMHDMEGQFEDSEEITVVESTYRISIHRRQKYRCRCNGHIETAPGPPKLVPGGRYSVDFAIHTAVGKYCDHLPLERQARRMERHGLITTSQTLWDQLDALAGHLEPTWTALGGQILSEPVLHVDETGWKMMGTEKPNWTVWGLRATDTAWYQLARSKNAAMAEKILGDYRGVLVADGYMVYRNLRKKRPDSIRLAHCWAHADRHFRDAKDPPDAIREIRSLIHQLYEIDRQVDGPFPGDAEAQARRAELRRESSAPVIAQIREWAFSQGGLKRSSFGKAVQYLLKYWDGLTLFLADPRVPLDNNAAERALRGVVVGRKNFYGTRSKRGARVASILYSLIETAKLRGVEPGEYLRRAAIAAIERPSAVTLPG